MHFFEVALRGGGRTGVGVEALSQEEGGIEPGIELSLVRLQQAPVEQIAAACVPHRY